MTIPFYRRRSIDHQTSTTIRRPMKLKCYSLYDDAVVDHRKAYSRGGQSVLKNGQLLCQVCNSGKGSR